ncbi:hypothetical protein BASA81_001730 [Batrachochytrium salamandrivorans]|nr:hypothetical protein BASA81_001730 [Batrachochytrium salamandrivorans]
MGVSGQCDGFGQVVNSSINGQPYCLCDALYSGGSDFFDTRFAVEGHPELSLTCTASRVGEFVLWGLIILAVIGFRVVPVSIIWREKYSALVNKQGGKYISQSGFKWSFALKLLTFDLVVLVPTCSVAAALKVAGQVLGTDIPVTVIYSLVPIFFQLENSMLASEEFRIVTHFLPVPERKRMTAMRNRLELMSWAAYCLGAFIPTIVALTLDKSLGPLINGEYVTILVRNLFIVLWSASATLANFMVFKSFENILSNEMRDRNNEAVNHMRKANKRLVIMYSSIALMYAVFCIPQLWGYQTYCYSIIVLLGVFRHPAKAFKSLSTFSTGEKDSKSNTVSPIMSERNLPLSSNGLPRPSEMGSIVVMDSAMSNNRIVDSQS